MKRTSKLVLGSVALVAIAAGGMAASAHRGGWGHHGGMGMGGPMGGLMGKICQGDASEMADLMLVRLEYKIKPTEAQKAAFSDLKTAAKAAALKAKAGCPPTPERAADGAAPPRKTPTERLALMETGLAAQLDAVRTVRPAADKLYATLSQEQKDAFPMMGGGKHWGKGHDGEGERGHRDRHGEEGRDAGDRAPPASAPSK